MSDYRPPLVQSLFPRGLEWQGAPAKFLSYLVEFPLRILAVAGPLGQGWFRHFRAGDETGAQIFGTLVPQTAVADYCAANWFASRAAEAGLSTPLLLGPPRVLGRGYAMLLRPWVDGRHGPADDLDFARCGRALGLLHEALGQISAAELSASRARLDKIAAQQPAWDRWVEIGDASVFRQLLERWPALVELVTRAPVHCHGDVHAGNLLFRPDGEPVFLDFEEAPHSTLNAMADIARFFERFILVYFDQHGAEWVSAQARLFFEAYRATRPGMRMVPIADALSFHHALSAQICFSSGSADHPIWRMEVEKLGKLISLSRRNEGLMAELDEIFARGCANPGRNLDHSV